MPENTKFDELAIRIYNAHRHGKKHIKPFQNISKAERDYWRGQAEQSIQNSWWDVTPSEMEP